MEAKFSDDDDAHFNILELKTWRSSPCRGVHLGMQLVCTGHIVEWYYRKQQHVYYHWK
jgi:hypothetical protein